MKTNQNIMHTNINNNERFIQIVDSVVATTTCAKTTHVFNNLPTGLPKLRK